MRHSFTGSLLGVFLMAAILQNAEARPGGSVKVFTLEDGVAFTMGTTDSKRLIYPAMGARRLTFNYSQSHPGDEFPQHVHGTSDDTFLVLQGEVDVRQGDSRRRLPTGHAAFVPGEQIHGTVTTGTGKAILISFQAPPDFRLYTGERDSSQPGAKGPTGVITPGAVQLMEYQNQDGFFIHPGMGSQRVAVAHRKLHPGQKFSAELPNDGEGMLFVWKGEISVKQKHSSGVYRVPERALLFAVDAGTLEVSGSATQQTVVIQIQSPPGSANW